MSQTAEEYAKAALIRFDEVVEELRSFMNAGGNGIKSYIPRRGIIYNNIYYAYQELGCIGDHEIPQLSLDSRNRLHDHFWDSRCFLNTLGSFVNWLKNQKSSLDPWGPIYRQITEDIEAFELWLWEGRNAGNRWWIPGR